MIINEKQVRFWNGNKSPSRREYEKQLLSLCLSETDFVDADILVDESDYPSADDEGNIFSKGCDVLVSVAGNQKLSGKPTRMIEIPVCKGILGHRLLIILKQHAKRFGSINSIDQLQKMTIGIPATWADADLFRKNGYKVSEKGSLDDNVSRLLAQKIDYITLGVNEIESILEQLGDLKKELLIEPNILIYYPLPLVFYVHPDKAQLANVVESGLKTAIANGKHAALFEMHHPNIVDRLALRTRKTLQLTNPYLPDSLKHFRAML
jgi:hypothetical protein